MRLALIVGFAAFLAIAGRNADAYLMAGMWLLLGGLYSLAIRKAL